MPHDSFPALDVSAWRWVRAALVSGEGAIGLGSAPTPTSGQRENPTPQGAGGMRTGWCPLGWAGASTRFAVTSRPALAELADRGGQLRCL